MNIDNNSFDDFEDDGDLKVTWKEVIYVACVFLLLGFFGARGAIDRMESIVEQNAMKAYEECVADLGEDECLKEREAARIEATHP